MKRQSNNSTSISTMLVTPEIASEFLKKNKDNRDKRKPVIQRLVSTLRYNEWIYTHQGIAFACSGRLIDGQHRLEAIVQSKVSARMVVARNVPDKAFEVIDQYKSRILWKELNFVKAEGSTLGRIIKFCEPGKIKSPTTLKRYSLALQLYFDDLSLSKFHGNHNLFNRADFLAGFVAALVMTRENDYESYEKMHRFFNMLREWQAKGSDLTTIPLSLPKSLKTLAKVVSEGSISDSSFDYRVTYAFLPKNWGKEIGSASRESVKSGIYDAFKKKMRSILLDNAIEDDEYIVPESYNGDIIAQSMTITPAMATSYLNGSDVFGYKSIQNAMENNNWVFTHQGIAFDYEGKLLDGRRRLKAIEQLGKSVQMMVYTNVHPNAKFAIDHGEVRNLADIFRVTPFVSGVARFAYEVHLTDEDAPDIKFVSKGMIDHNIISSCMDLVRDMVTEMFGRPDFRPTGSFKKRAFVLGVIVSALKYKDTEDVDRIYQGFHAVLKGKSNELSAINDLKLFKFHDDMRGKKIKPASKKTAMKPNEITYKEALSRAFFAFDLDEDYIKAIRKSRINEVFNDIKVILRRNLGSGGLV